MRTVTTPSVLILKEKHGRRYFDASTNEKLYAISLQIVKQRHAEKWYPSEVIDEPVEPEPLPDLGGLSPAMVTAMQETHHRLRVAYKADLRRYLESLDNYERLQKALVDGKAAWRYLSDRKCSEYEGIGLEPLENSYT